MVLASGDIKECFYDAVIAFNYVERFQLPVIHLIDKALANSSQTFPIFETKGVKIERGNILDEDKLKGFEYKKIRFHGKRSFSQTFSRNKRRHSLVYWR
ncbi:MAG: hypothetical protein QXX99_02160 [Candidatus Bathyarchaeia archaeon]